MSIKNSSKSSNLIHNQEDKKLNFSVTASLYNKLKRESEKRGVSMSALIRTILFDYFEAK